VQFGPGICNKYGMRYALSPVPSSTIASQKPTSFSVLPIEAVQHSTQLQVHWVAGLLSVPCCLLTNTVKSRTTHRVRVLTDGPASSIAELTSPRFRTDSSRLLPGDCSVLSDLLHVPLAVTILH